MIQEFKIEPNEYLHQEIQGFYRCDYVGYRKENNPDYINTIKNTFNRESKTNLDNAIQLLTESLPIELTDIFQKINVQSITICVVPRSKALKTYAPNQLLFKQCISQIIDNLSKESNINLENGTDFIIRHTDTCTTHLAKSSIGGGDGKMPYVGITQDTCTISSQVKNKHILLIDDIYTKTVNIDEDCIQTLLNNGAKSVHFFAIARTALKSRWCPKEDDDCFF